MSTVKYRQIIGSPAGFREIVAHEVPSSLFVPCQACVDCHANPRAKLVPKGLPYLAYLESTIQLVCHTTKRGACNVWLSAAFWGGKEVTAPLIRQCPLILCLLNREVLRRDLTAH